LRGLGVPRLVVGRGEETGVGEDLGRGGGVWRGGGGAGERGPDPAAADQFHQPVRGAGQLGGRRVRRDVGGEKLEQRSRVVEANGRRERAAASGVRDEGAADRSREGGQELDGERDVLRVGIRGEFEEDAAG